MLIVDPNLPAATALARIVEPDSGHHTGSEVALCADFWTARARLRAAPPELLITALRLREYNGLNLVYLAAGAGLPTRSIVYTEANDAGMAREIRAAGAFYDMLDADKRRAIEIVVEERAAEVDPERAADGGDK